MLLWFNNWFNMLYDSFNWVTSLPNIRGEQRSVLKYYEVIAQDLLILSLQNMSWQSWSKSHPYPHWPSQDKSSSWTSVWTRCKDMHKKSSSNQNLVVIVYCFASEKRHAGMLVAKGKLKGWRHLTLSSLENMQWSCRSCLWKDSCFVSVEFFTCTASPYFTIFHRFVTPRNGLLFIAAQLATVYGPMPQRKPPCCTKFHKESEVRVKTEGLRPLRDMASLGHNLKGERPHKNCCKFAEQMQNPLDRPFAKHQRIKWKMKHSFLNENISFLSLIPWLLAFCGEIFARRMALLLTRAVPLKRTAAIDTTWSWLRNSEMVEVGARLWVFQAVCCELFKLRYVTLLRFQGLPGL